MVSTVTPEDLISAMEFWGKGNKWQLTIDDAVKMVDGDNLAKHNAKTEAIQGMVDYWKRLDPKRQG